MHLAIKYLVTVFFCFLIFKYSVECILLPYLDFHFKLHYYFVVVTAIFKTGSKLCITLHETAKRGFRIQREGGREGRDGKERMYVHTLKSFCINAHTWVLSQLQLKPETWVKQSVHDIYIISLSTSSFVVPAHTCICTFFKQYKP